MGHRRPGWTDTGGALKTIYLSLGSNLGDRRSHIDEAVASLEAGKIQVLARSSFYETAPQDVEDQPWFLNIALGCKTSYFPLQLLAVLQRIEREGGRVRGGRSKGPRAIDIDILLYGEHVIDTAQLTVPHPSMLKRRFVLEPLVEIAPELKHPVTRQSLASYLRSVQDQPLRKIYA